MKRKGGSLSNMPKNESEDETMQMTIDPHAFDRMALRLEEAEKQRVVSAIEGKWNRLENNSYRDFAIIAMELKNLRMMDDTGWESNGDAVVGIVRRGQLKTVMLRRMTQPMTNEALRVDAVKWAITPPRDANFGNNRNGRKRNRRGRRY